MNKLLLVPVFVLLAFKITAQAKLLKDIYNFSSSNGFNREQLLIDKTLYFVAKSKNEGSELWATDGTPANTRLVKEINIGQFDDGNPIKFTNYKNKLYFTALDNTHGRELWASDGTESGTQLVKEIFIGQSSSFLSNESGSFIEYDGKFYFGAEGSFAIGRELYVSDGTTQGTNIVADYLATGGVNPTSFILFNNKLFFSGTSESFGGTQLMTYDASTNKISLVKKINANGSSVDELISANNYFLFKASEATYGNEIYISDGTANGTKLLKDLSPGAASSTTSFYGVINNKVFFCLNGTLYVTDGTTNGTISLNMNCPISASIHNNLFYFGASNPNANVGVELYVTDGTVSGTKLIKDISTGNGSSNPGNFAIIKSKLYFSATTAANGMELWESDGTDPGTKLLEDIHKGADGSAISRMSVLNDKTLFFFANDGLTGEEPWIYEFQTTAIQDHSSMKYLLKDLNDSWYLLPNSSDSHTGQFNIKVLDLEGKIIYSRNHDAGMNEMRIPKPGMNGYYSIVVEHKGRISFLKTLVIE